MEGHIGQGLIFTGYWILGIGSGFLVVYQALSKTKNLTPITSAYRREYRYQEKLNNELRFTIVQVFSQIANYQLFKIVYFNFARPL